MIDINKKYKTRNGRAVTHLHRAPEDWPGEGPWRGMAGHTACAWNEDGSAPFAGDGFTLIEVREPRELWVIEKPGEVPGYYNCQQFTGHTMEPYPHQTLFREVIEEVKP